MTFKTPPAYTFTTLPTTGNTDGDLRSVLDTGIVYLWVAASSSWVSQNTRFDIFNNPAYFNFVNIDAGAPDSVYGGVPSIDCGSP